MATVRLPQLRPWPWLTCVGAVLALAAQWWPWFASTLSLTRTDLAQWQLWRLWSGQFTHWSVKHLFWDLLGFVVLGFLAERFSRCRFAVTAVLSGGAIGLWVWLGETSLTSLRGLSGIDSALFVFVAVWLLRRGITERDRWQASLAGAGLIAFAAKCIAEVWLGRPIFVTGGGFEPVPIAHLIGGAAGALISLAPHRGGDWAAAGVGS